MTARIATLALLLCSTIAGCSGSSEQACTLDSDCASGFCKTNGTCGAAETDGGLDGDGGSDGQSGVCNPNHDGIISLDELPFAAGRMGKFRIATGATWNTAGVAATNGQRRWDLTGALSNDQDRDLALGAPAGMWWAADYPTATYATPLSSSSDLRGVFQLGSANLNLLGVVSPDGGTYKTELAYDPPVQVLAIPMQAGSTWSSTSTVSGYAQGVYGVYTEAYESHVDQVGTMVTPYGEFPVLRVATALTRTSGFTTLATSRTYTWVAECFGPVATATSQNFESSNEFTDIAEVRRLAP